MVEKLSRYFTCKSGLHKVAITVTLFQTLRKFCCLLFFFAVVSEVFTSICNLITFNLVFLLAIYVPSRVTGSCSSRQTEWNVDQLAGACLLILFGHGAFLQEYTYKLQMTERSAAVVQTIEPFLLASHSLSLFLVVIIIIMTVNKYYQLLADLVRWVQLKSFWLNG